MGIGRFYKLDEHFERLHVEAALRQTPSPL